MEYIRLCKDLTDKGTLLPAGKDLSNLYSKINKEKDNYYSIYYYNENHKKQFDEKGTITGITDVTTDRLVFDFDSDNKDLSRVENIDLSRADAIEIVNRLQKEGIGQDSIQIYFSGGKGFEVSVRFEGVRLTPREAKNIGLNLAEGLKTFDPVVYNASRIFRLPLTKHQKSGLYKSPLTVSDLESMSTEDIMENAKQNLEYSDIKDAWKTTKMSKKMLELKEKAPEVTTAKATVSLGFTADDIDWSTMPKDYKPTTWLLEMGFYPNGSRNRALLILASRYRYLNMTQNKAYYLLKASADSQSERTGTDRIHKKEIWSVVNSVYSELWNGHTFSDEEEPLLVELSSLVPVVFQKPVESYCKVIQQSIGSFMEYAKDIDKNIIKTGLKALDENLQLQAGRLYAILAAPGVGKCHGIDTPIMMFDGSIKMVQDVQVGDLLMGDDSTPRTVLSLARGQETLYKIKQNNGDDYVVNESHILSLKGSSGSDRKQYEYGKVFDIPLKEYINKGVDFKKRVKGYKVPVNFTKKETQIDPYILGLWLGDGTTNKPQFTIAKKDTQIIEAIQGWSDQQRLNCTLKQYESSSENVYTVNITGNGNNTFLKFLQDTKLVEGKFIPNNFLTSDKKDRLYLLAGLLDTDGYLDTSKNSFEFSSSNETLTDQTMFLARSLGYKVSKSKDLKHYRSFTKGKLYEGDSVAYRLYITGDNLDEIPTLLPRKRALKQDKQRYQDLTEITVEKLEVGDYFGFTLDGNHRYLLGDFTVTHNTTLTLQMINHVSKSGELNMMASYDMGEPDVLEKLALKHFRISKKELYRRIKEDPEFVNKLDIVLTREYPNTHFIFRTGQTIDELKQSISETEKKTGRKVRMLIVDYLELIQSKFSDPTQASMESIQGLREIAINMNICVIVLLQPSKMGTSINEPVTSYTMAKGSSSIQQAVTAMLTLHRPGYSSRTPENDLYMGVDCVKNRSGALFSLDFYFDGKYSEIRELEPIEAMNLHELRNRMEQERRNGEDLFS